MNEIGQQIVCVRGQSTVNSLWPQTCISPWIKLKVKNEKYNKTTFGMKRWKRECALFSMTAWLRHITYITSKPNMKDFCN